jgi:hypothetical protein
VSRLDFAPELEEIKITDIKKGLGTFVPKADKPASFAALKAALKKAGYTLDSAEITAVGTLVKDDTGWWIEVEPFKQRFAVESKDTTLASDGATPGTRIEVTGDWRTVDSGASAREVITPRSIKKIAATSSPKTSDSLASIQVSLNGTSSPPGLFLSPIRTTSPGLTVYKGGAIAAEYLSTRQHLGSLKVDRHNLQFSFSYTPTPTLQLAAEIPYGYTSFKSGLDSGSGRGFGNVTVWGKYRFYRTLETWGDRQAAVRFGVELPTGKKSAPNESELQADSFLRQQITPINGGLSVHADTTYSQAKGRFIYGANIEGIVRSERDGNRLGHELRVNTDFEYVLLPFKYRRPTKELFAILETTFLHRRQGHAGGVTVPGSSSTEFYLEPGLQYVATERLALEASYQLPVVRNTGPLVLRTDANLLVRIKYLY